MKTLNQTKLNNQTKLKVKFWHFLIIVILLLGSYLRLNNPEHKIYWMDEVFSSLRISGYTENEVREQIHTGQIFSAEELIAKYQYPNSQKGIRDSLNSLTVEGAQHPPLYFIGLRFWTQLWGNSIGVIRSFSILFSLLCFPAIYLLCKELFKSSQIAWIAMAIIAVSPFHYLYGQAARQYSLWCFLTLLSAWGFLRAIRIGSRRSWSTYAVLISLNFYTFPFSLFNVTAQGVYLFILSSFKLTKAVKNYLLSLLFAVVSFIPWLIFAILSLSHVKGTTNWLTRNLYYGLPELFFRWLRNLTSLFLDLDNSLSLSTIKLTPYITFPIPFPYILVALIVLVLVGYSLLLLYRHTPRSIWLYIFLLITATILPLVVPDLISGGRRSSIARYMLPAYLGIQISIAHLIFYKVFQANSWQKLWQILATLLLCLGIFSCFYSSREQVWWNNSRSKATQIPIVAPIINQASAPLVISDLSYWENSSLQSDNMWNYVLTLTHYVKPSVKFKLSREVDISQLPNDFSDVFLYSPSDSEKLKLLKEVTAQYSYRLEPAYTESKIGLWRIIK